MATATPMPAASTMPMRTGPVRWIQVLMVAFRLNTQSAAAPPDVSPWSTRSSYQP